MICRTCKIEKELGDMSNSWNNQRQRRFYGPDCKACRQEKRRADTQAKARDTARKAARYASDPEFRDRTLAAQRQWRYGITREQFDAVMAAQGGGCAVCGTTTPDGNGWHVDHDHACCGTLNTAIRRRSCGKCARGILCNRCNLAMGRLRDDPKILLKMYDYLTSERSIPA